MATKIQLRRDTAANWTAQNPILSEGEIGYDSTNKQLRVGDGTTNWLALPGIYTGAVIDLSDYSTTAEMNTAIAAAQPDLSGYATTQNVSDAVNGISIGYDSKTLDDYVEQVNVASSNSITVDPANGSIVSLAASGDITITASGWQSGQTVSLFITNTGTRTITFSGGALFANGDNEISNNSIVSITLVGTTYWVSISKDYG